MEALNRAIGDADAFTKMLEKVARRDRTQAPTLNPPDVLEWNAEVERKRAEKLARKLAKVKP